MWSKLNRDEQENFKRMNGDCTFGFFKASSNIFNIAYRYRLGNVQLPILNDIYFVQHIPLLWFGKLSMVAAVKFING